MCDRTPGWSSKQTELLYFIMSAHTTIFPDLFFSQSSPQRDFVVLAVQTPHRDGERQPKASKGVSPLEDIDVEWVTEHAKQVISLMSSHLHSGFEMFYSLVVQ